MKGVVILSLRIMLVSIALFALPGLASAQQCASGTCTNLFGITLPVAHPLRAALSLPSARLGEAFMSGDFTPRQGLIDRIRENRTERKAARGVK